MFVRNVPKNLERVKKRVFLRLVGNIFRLSEQENRTVDFWFLVYLWHSCLLGLKKAWEKPKKIGAWKIEKLIFSLLSSILFNLVDFSNKSNHYTNSDKSPYNLTYSYCSSYLFIHFIIIHTVKLLLTYICWANFLLELNFALLNSLWSSLKN